MNIFEAVYKFWEIGHPDKIATKPGFPDEEVAKLNMTLIKEESKQFNVSKSAVSQAIKGTTHGPRKN